MSEDDRNDKLSVAIASDHAGLEMKTALVKALAEWKIPAEDLGPKTADSVDYPDYAEAVAMRVSGGKAPFGVLVCGTGIGMSITANKFPNVRAAILYDDYTASYARLHNDANIAAFGARTMSVEAAVSRLKVFLSTKFEKGRHARRVNRIASIEKRIARQG